ncbi:MAG: ferrous iron transport protein B [Planctomycetota bacterium]|nr:ferrous iron transport protein B [Planctomycetota bacterium]
MHLEVRKPPAPAAEHPCVALIGNPNAGKTTLFNALTGLRAKTANFPGTTVERRSGKVTLGGRVVEILDLPGLYSLTSATPEEVVARDSLLGAVPGHAAPLAAVLIVDATNLERNLYLASQVLELKLPTLVALNMMDLASAQGLKLDLPALSKELGCPVVGISARTGAGLEELRRLIEQTVDEPAQAKPSVTPSCSGCDGCPHSARYDWAEGVGSRCTVATPVAKGSRTEKIDQFLTDPVVGVVAFLAVMLVVFTMIFSIAQYPMDWIKTLFQHAQTITGNHLPEGDFRSLLNDGVIGGVGGMLVFLPQICILFFFLSLLEDTGYLARAAFVMDRLMRFVGLPGKAFVPLLSAHACAIPAIMATRVIEDRRDRLVTILVAPFMACSARIPVYTMLASGLLFPHSPLKAAVLFTIAYCTGIIAALGTAWLFKRTLLKGESRPLVLELPGYKTPSLRTALLTMIDRAMVFVKKAGSVILLLSILLWALATYPKSEAPAEVQTLTKQSEELKAAGKEAEAGEIEKQAKAIEEKSALNHSFAGRVGHFIEPVIAPMGFDWQIGVGIITSLAAREVIVSTLAIVYGVGSEAAEENRDSIYDSMRKATRADGSPVYTTATCLSLLVFYVLAMQCLSTLAVTRRETGSWKWAAFQQVYMSSLAYVAAVITYQSVVALGIA